MAARTGTHTSLFYAFERPEIFEMRGRSLSLVPEFLRIANYKGRDAYGCIFQLT